MLGSLQLLSGQREQPCSEGHQQRGGCTFINPVQQDAVCVGGACMLPVFSCCSDSLCGGQQLMFSTCSSLLLLLLLLLPPLSRGYSMALGGKSKQQQQQQYA
jgi:hypothetical protein